MMLGDLPFYCLEERLAAGAGCEKVAGEVSGGPFQDELHGNRLFCK